MELIASTTTNSPTDMDTNKKRKRKPPKDEELREELEAEKIQYFKKKDAVNQKIQA